MSISRLTRWIEAQGWSWRRTHGNHLICRHPDAAYPVFTASTPSDHRYMQNLACDMRRAIRASKRDGKT